MQQYQSKDQIRNNYGGCYEDMVGRYILDSQNSRKNRGDKVSSTLQKALRKYFLEMELAKMKLYKTSPGKMKNK